MSSAAAASAGGAHRASGAPAGARPARTWLWRVAAGVLWAVALAFGVAACNALVQGAKAKYIFAFLLLDLGLVVAGLVLQGRAASLEEVAGADGAGTGSSVQRLVRQLGVVLAAVAFPPVVIVFLADGRVDRRVLGASALAGVAALAGLCVSVAAYQPVTQQQFDAVQAQASLLAENGQCYFKQDGQVYHFNPHCRGINGTGSLQQADVADTLAAGKVRGCKFCTRSDGKQLLASVAENQDVLAQAAANEREYDGVLERGMDLGVDTSIIN